MTRTWDGFAQEGEHRYLTVDTRRRMMKFRGVKDEDILNVKLIEDPTGEYFGWIDTGKENPEMIRTETIFQVQFPGGYQELVDRGRGQVVRLRIERS